MTDTTDTGPDLLYGAKAIADYLGVTRRVAYHLVEQAKNSYLQDGQDCLRPPKQARCRA